MLWPSCLQPACLESASQKMHLLGQPARCKSGADPRRVGGVGLRAKQHGHAQVERQDGEVAAPGGRPMAFEEKRRLSQGLGALAGDKLGVVMEIIAESQRYDSVRPALLSRRSLQAHSTSTW